MKKDDSIKYLGSVVQEDRKDSRSDMEVNERGRQSGVF